MKKIGIVLSLLFIVVLLLPLLVFFNRSDSSLLENKISNVSDYISALGYIKYDYSENYAYKDFLVTINGIIKTKLFRVSSSQKVLMGREGWLYLVSEQSLDNHRNIYKFSNEEIDRWKAVLSKRKDFSQKQGSDYYFVISPDKSDIYPEYLPEKFHITNPESRKEILEGSLADLEIEEIRLTKRLISKKGGFPLYYKTDTHWNELGAYYAYLSIIEVMQKNYPNLDIKDNNLTISEEKTHGGDLARLMGLENQKSDILYHVDYYSSATLENGSPIALQMIDVQHAGQINTVCSDGEIDRGVIFHDSFGVALIPYLARHFKEAAFVRSDDFDSQLVEKYKPNVIIQQIVERRLLNWQPDEYEIK